MRLYADIQATPYVSKYEGEHAVLDNRAITTLQQYFLSDILRTVIMNAKEPFFAPTGILSSWTCFQQILPGAHNAFEQGVDDLLEHQGYHMSCLSTPLRVYSSAELELVRFMLIIFHYNAIGKDSALFDGWKLPSVNELFKSSVQQEIIRLEDGNEVVLSEGRINCQDVIDELSREDSSEKEESEYSFTEEGRLENVGSYTLHFYRHATIINSESESENESENESESNSSNDENENGIVRNHIENEDNINTTENSENESINAENEESITSNSESEEQEDGDDSRSDVRSTTSHTSTNSHQSNPSVASSDSMSFSGIPSPPILSSPPIFPPPSPPILPSPPSPLSPLSPPSPPSPLSPIFPSPPVLPSSTTPPSLFDLNEKTLDPLPTFIPSYRPLANPFTFLMNALSNSAFAPSYDASCSIFIHNVSYILHLIDSILISDESSSARTPLPADLLRGCDMSITTANSHADFTHLEELRSLVKELEAVEKSLVEKLYQRTQASADKLRELNVVITPLRLRQLELRSKIVSHILDCLMPLVIPAGAQMFCGYNTVGVSLEPFQGLVDTLLNQDPKEVDEASTFWKELRCRSDTLGSIPDFCRFSNPTILRYRDPICSFRPSDCYI